jgi:hypothetical protein
VRDIGPSVELRALTGARRLRELHGDTVMHHQRWQCGETGRTTEPTSVIVHGYGGFRSSSSPTLAAPIRASSKSAPPR